MLYNIIILQYVHYLDLILRFKLIYALPNKKCKKYNAEIK